MGYKIDPAIVGSASMCQRGHACIGGQEGLYCRPVDLMSDGDTAATLIECPAQSGCPYCFSFGGTHICQCPVRAEIFKRFGA